MSCSVIRAITLVICLLAFAWLRDANAEGVSRFPLRTVSEIRGLSPTELAMRPPVLLTGVVTYCEPGWFLTFIEDETGGIYLGTTPASPLNPGDRVRVNGVASEGRISAIVTGKNKTEPEVTVFRRDELPTAKEADSQHLFDNTYDASWIALRGVVQSVARVNDRASLQVDVDGNSFIILVRGPFEERNLPRYLVGTTIIARGVVGGADKKTGVNTNLVLYVPSLKECTPDTRYLEEQFRVAPGTYTDLFSKSGKLRIEGVVTHARPGIGFFMRVLDHGYPSGSVWVQTSQPIELATGMRVDLIASVQYSNLKPWLRDAIVRPSGKTVRVEPQAWSIEQITSGDNHGMLVSIDGEVVEQRHGLHDESVILLCDNVTGCVRLQSQGTEPRLPEYLKGSRIRVVGTTVLQMMPDLDTGPFPFRFQLLLRNADDITLISRPPWWTIQKLLILLTAVLAIAMTGFIWVIALRRRVTAQTAAIRKHIERETLQEERMRVAREFHDTFEQHLVGLGLTLQTAQADASVTPRIRDLLNEAVEMTRHTRTEAKHAIWEMRTGSIVSSDLPLLLRTELRGLAEAAQVDLNVVISGSVRPLPAVVQNHLLRIAQESITNAVKHAQARSIEISVTYSERVLALKIRDDGIGFDTTKLKSTSGASFGICGMHERANRMRGSFRISSTPGSGCEISITVPA